jgi:hypothetical protein
MSSTLRQRELIDDEIMFRLNAIRATTVMASCGELNDPGIEGTFHALMLLTTGVLKAVDELREELEK